LLQSNFTTPASMVHFAHLHDIFYLMLPRALFQLRCIAHVIPFLFSPRLITILLPAKTLPCSSMKRRMPPLTSSCRSMSHPPQSGTCCTRHKTNTQFYSFMHRPFTTLCTRVSFEVCRAVGPCWRRLRVASATASAAGAGKTPAVYILSGTLTFQSGHEFISFVIRLLKSSRAAVYRTQVGSCKGHTSRAPASEVCGGQALSM